MIEGESGLLAIYPEDEKPIYIKNAAEVRFRSGARAQVYTDEVPDAFRGPQHEKAWCDEPSAWKNLRRSWDNLLMGLRLGRHPQIVATCTPKRRKAYRDIFHAKAGNPMRIARTKGTSWDNLSNLSPIFMRILKTYAGSRLARQEIDGMFLEEIEGSLWTESGLDHHRAKSINLDLLSSIVVGVDPAVTSTEKSNETGIIVAGRSSLGQGYTLADYSLRAPPEEWGQAVVDAYHRYRADAVVGEGNQGGDLVERNIKAIDPSVNYIKVSATRGKKIRAEPISTLYRRGQIHHASSIDFGDGVLQLSRLEDLEDQMIQWDPDHERDRDNEVDDADSTGREVASPDRVDALVWAYAWLFGRDTVDQVSILSQWE